MDNEGACIGKPCGSCGRIIGGGDYFCPNCKACFCFSCGILQITDCKDMELLKSGTIPKCPKCGTKLQ